MFEARTTPRVFGLAPGVDFPKGLHDGLILRSEGHPAETLARVQLIVNTARMERRLKDLFDTGPARLLPRVHLLTRIDGLDPALTLPPAVSPLRRRLELITLVSRLIDQQPDLAPRSSLYDLTDSLANLMDEMQGEGVAADTIFGLDVSDDSGHWQRAQTFIRIAHEYLQHGSTTPDKEARQRLLVTMMAERWAINPPQHPVILAGSTGSRGTTMLLMEAIAQLPQGALVLPGFDFDMPLAQWLHLDDPLLSEDHPQYRFHKLLSRLGVGRSQVQHWHDTPPPSAPRNALVSLSLRPAPVTDAWLTEGPKLPDLDRALENVTLVEAPSPRSEALTIALRLRQAVEDGQKAAVITPDRMLTRQITAALDAWDILPDDSAGTPLQLSPPGRFLRHVAALLHRRLDAEALLTLLKHPLTHSATDRGDHVLNTQRLELKIRQKGLPYPDAEGVSRLMKKAVSSADQQGKIDSWADWVGRTITGREMTGERPLSEWVEAHISLSETISSGPDTADTGELWQKNAGQAALKVIDNLRDQAEYGSSMTAADYANLVGALLAEGEVRDRDAPHPDVMIWGTLEARVQGADLVILAGLNDGTWPEAPAPDPWLNRKLRNAAGLLLPERRIGLSAHDYQQAIAAPEVWLTRAIRSDDAETVASRWINRLCNLLDGLKTQHGPELLKGMRARGNDWIAKAALFEAVESEPSAPRPSPRPPLAARPREMVVTDIKHLIRDPYAIYAKRVLRLRKLGPLVQNPDALSRGTVSHEVMERFIRLTIDNPGALARDAMLECAQTVLQESVPWPAARALWLARLQRIADWFIANEHRRRSTATPVALEQQAAGKLVLQDIGFTLIGRADRIDRTDSGEVLLYDYKTGAAPTTKQQRSFDKQLLIEAAMIEEGAFENIEPSTVLDAVFISLGSGLSEVSAPLEDEPTQKVLDELRQLIVAYQDPAQGFTARRMMQKDSFGSDYDLLSRFGEWDITEDPAPEDLK
ncbi:MAG: double-strand break repair protein AddB [Roseobacter sp.]